MARCSGGVRGIAIAIALGSLATARGDDDRRALSLAWDREILTIRGAHLPGGAVEILYIEAYCRPGSTKRDWKQTVIPHKTERVAADPDGRRIRLRSRLEDGVVVDHEIRAGQDEVDFRVVATNPTGTESQAQWAQPCIRVDRYAGVKREHASEAYLPRCFLYVDGRPVRMPTTPWARTAVYTPGQVWCPEGVSRDDVNPRPLSPIVPSNGLIGCVSADGRELLATAWEPYQELFQGVIVCLHSDFRIGGLKPGQSKSIRGKLYLMPADFPALRARYRRDFPEQAAREAPAGAGGPARKLIEFGWDEPDTSFLRGHLAELERTPFDGCVFHADAQARPGRAGEPHLAGLGPACVHGRGPRRGPGRPRGDRGLGDAVPPQLPPLQHDARRPRLVRRPLRGDRQRRGWPPGWPAPADARGSSSIPNSTRGSSSTTASSATPAGAPGPSTPPRPAAAAAR